MRFFGSVLLHVSNLNGAKLKVLRDFVFLQIRPAIWIFVHFMYSQYTYCSILQKIHWISFDYFQYMYSVFMYCPYTRCMNEKFGYPKYIFHSANFQYTHNFVPYILCLCTISFHIYTISAKFHSHIQKRRQKISRNIFLQ